MKDYPVVSYMEVIARTDDAVYLRIPKELQRLTPGCSCPYCKAHPLEVSAWDTLAVPLAIQDHAWTVHMPDPEEFMRQVAKQKREIPAKLVRP